MIKYIYYQYLMTKIIPIQKIRFVLFGLRAHLALHQGASEPFLQALCCSPKCPSSRRGSQVMAPVLAKIRNAEIGHFGRNPCRDGVFLAQSGVMAACLSASRAAQPSLVLSQKPLRHSLAERVQRLHRSPLSHSYGYDSAGDRPICFASYTLIPESFMQYAG